MTDRKPTYAQQCFLETAIITGRLSEYERGGGYKIRGNVIERCIGYGWARRGDASFVITDEGRAALARCKP